MARREFGSIARIDRDVYRLRWMEDTPKGRVRRSETVHGTRREAAARLSQIETELERGYGGCPTLKAVHDDYWWPSAQETLKANTKKMYEHTWKTSVEPEFGSVPVDKIAPAAVQKWLLTMPLGIAKTARGVLRQVLNHAVMFGFVDRNVTDVKFRMPENARTMSKKVWDMDELAELYSKVAEGTYIAVPFILQAFGGCRAGESLSPRLDEVKEVEVDGMRMATFTVVRTVAGDGSIGTPKTKASEASVFIPEPWCDVVLAQRDDYASKGYTWLNDDWSGNPVGLARVEKTWARALKKAGIEHAPMRNLRNSYATNIHWDMGVTIEKAAKLMRHSSPNTTIKHYDRPQDDMRAAAVAEAFSAKSCAVRTK